MPCNDTITITVRRNDALLILGALTLEAHHHSDAGRHATAAWAHDLAAKIADATGNQANAEIHRNAAAEQTTAWQTKEDEKAATEGREPRRDPAMTRRR